MSESTPSPTPNPVGSLWEIPTKGAAIVTRPDGSSATVIAEAGKPALYILDVPGEFSAVAVDGSGKAHVVEAG